MACVSDGLTYSTATQRLSVPISLKKFIKDELNKQDMDNDKSRVVILITHHLPSYKSIHSKYQSETILNHAYYSNLDYLYPYIDYFFHGHTHTSHDYYINENEKRGRVICNPKGYFNENKFYNPKLMITI